jgi:hypothetical protein
MTKDEIKSRIEELETEMKNFEIDPDDYLDAWDDCLDEISIVRIGSLEYSASHVLKEVDPTAYRCGLIDYVDGLDKTEDPHYQELEEELEELQDELNDLEAEED